MSNAALSLVEFVIALSVLLFLHESVISSGRLFGIVAEIWFGYPQILKLAHFAGRTLLESNTFVLRPASRVKQSEVQWILYCGKWKRLVT